MLLYYSFALLFSWFYTTNAASPIQQPWSQKAYGPDGPWNAVTMNLQGQSVDLNVGCYYESWILGPSYCSNRTLFGSHSCDASSAGLVTPPAISAASLPAYEPYAAWMDGMPGNGTASTLYPLNFQIPVTNPPTIPNVSIASVNSSWLTLPDGTDYPATLGCLSIGGPAINQSFGFTSASSSAINYSLIPSYLYSKGFTSSASVGIHIGSAQLGIPGSMFWGGYDRSRALGDVMVTTSITSGQLPPPTGVELQDIGIGTAVGGSPFSFPSKSGLLAQGNSSISGKLFVEVVNQSPYLYLPKSTCDAIAANLPVTYMSKYGLYFWNTQDPNYARIVTSASFLSFQFRADNLPARNLTIKVPWALLNLTLQSPIVDTPVQYFPCRPFDPPPGTAYVLGKAFMQAAFMAIDWNPNAPPGNWFMAQAPGPGTASYPDTQAISNGASSISSSPVSWEDSWKGHWTPLTDSGSSTAGASTSASSSSAASSASASQQGLGTAAAAGIGVGVGAAAIAGIVGILFFLRRRRQQRRRTAATQPSWGPPVNQSIPEKSATEYHSGPAPAYEAEAHNPNQVFELGDERAIPELH